MVTTGEWGQQAVSTGIKSRMGDASFFLWLKGLCHVVGWFNLSIFLGREGKDWSLSKDMVPCTRAELVIFLPFQGS